MNRNFKTFEKYNLKEFLQEIEKEWNNQDLKFPNQTHTIEKWLSIIVEEIGEIAKEINNIHNEYDLTNLHNEIIQSITLLIRLRYSVHVITEENPTIFNIII